MIKRADRRLRPSGGDRRPPVMERRRAAHGPLGGRTNCSWSSLALLLLVFTTTYCWHTAYAQGTSSSRTPLKRGSSNVSVRGGCGATPSSHGVCGPDGKLRCRTGYSGKLCDKPQCREGCHPQQGFCTKPKDCICKMGWQGDRCDECVPLPGCQHGHCNNSSFQCHCHAGWTGPHCSDAVCRKGCHTTRGYCESPGECKCRIGWTGPTCNDCATVPGCQNGYCYKPLECRCDDGWDGHLCQNPVCTEGCHQEHGSCSKPEECRCEVGWYGTTCGTCHPYPGCKNGYCSRPWECICKSGWTGMMCDKRIKRVAGFCESNSDVCLNGGTCIDVLGPRNYTCSCPSLFTGKRCDYLAERRSRPNYHQRTTSTSTTTSTTTTPASTTKIPSSTEASTSRPAFRTTAPLARPLFSLSGRSANRADREDEYDPPIVEDYDETPRGQHSRIHSVTASPRKVKQQKRQRQLEAKNARRLFLQKQATITFRQPKIVPTIRTRSRPLKLPFTVIDRKHLSLPVFLPRVSEVVRKNITKNKSSSENKKDSDQPIKIQSSKSNMNVTTERPKINIDLSKNETSPNNFKNVENTTSIDVLDKELVENKTFSNIKEKVQPLQPTYLDETEQSSVIEKETEGIVDSHHSWKEDDYSEQSRGEQTIKDLLEEYGKPKPVLVVNFESTPDKNYNQIIKADDNQIEDSINFINEKGRFLQPGSINLALENSQETTASGPSRPMFLVAVRPLPHPDGTIRPIHTGPNNPIIGFSHGNYPAATFLQESRNGRFLPQGRSAGSVRSPIQFTSPSFSVSQPHSYNVRHFAPQTRLSRRIGHASSPPYSQSFPEKDHLIPKTDSLPAASETKFIHFYQVHSAGSVHIGVDRHTPPEDLITAFIEIKKSFI